MWTVAEYFKIISWTFKKNELTEYKSYDIGYFLLVRRMYPKFGRRRCYLWLRVWQHTASIVFLHVVQNTSRFRKNARIGIKCKNYNITFEAYQALTISSVDSGFDLTTFANQNREIGVGLFHSNIIVLYKISAETRQKRIRSLQPKVKKSEPLACSSGVLVRKC